MFKAIATLFFCVCSLATKNVYAGYDEDIAAINKGMPKQVKLFNMRKMECNHWAGEEPYDDERANQVDAAVKESRCANLDKDEKKLLKKYKSEPKVIDSINKAKVFY